MHLRNRFTTSLATASCGVVAAVLAAGCSGSGANMISLVEPPVAEPTAVATTLPLTLDPTINDDAAPLPTPVDISQPAAFIVGDDVADDGEGTDESTDGSSGPGAKAKRSTADN